LSPCCRHRVSENLAALEEKVMANIERWAELHDRILPTTRFDHQPVLEGKPLNRTRPSRTAGVGLNTSGKSDLANA
jgi:hypothetical protein